MFKYILIILLLIFSSAVYAEVFEVIDHNENELIIKFVLPEYDTEVILIRLFVQTHHILLKMDIHYYLFLQR